MPKSQINRNDVKKIEHDKYKWGKLRDTTNTEKIQTHNSKLDINKKNKCVTCDKNYKFIGSVFCSKNCYEYYFIPKFN